MREKEATELKAEKQKRDKGSKKVGGGRGTSTRICTYELKTLRACISPARKNQTLLVAGGENSGIARNDERETGASVINNLDDLISKVVISGEVILVLKITEATESVLVVVVSQGATGDFSSSTFFFF